MARTIPFQYAIAALALCVALVPAAWSQTPDHDALRRLKTVDWPRGDLLSAGLDLPIPVVAPARPR